MTRENLSREDDWRYNLYTESHYPNLVGEHMVESVTTQDLTVSTLTLMRKTVKAAENAVRIGRIVTPSLRIDFLFCISTVE